MRTFVSVWFISFCFVLINTFHANCATGIELTFDTHEKIILKTDNQLFKDNIRTTNSENVIGKNAATGGKETAATFVNNSLSCCLSPVAGCFSSKLSRVTSHFQVVWQTPFNPMTFYILSAKINGLDLLPGDEIGIFDIDPTFGNEICVGAGVLTEVLSDTSFLEIIASMNDGSIPGQNNGFTAGNPILYKFWTPENGEIAGVIPSYPFAGYDEVFTPLGTAFAELNALVEITQTINLQPGWNLASFRVQPQNPDMLWVVQPLILQEILLRVLDENGGSIYQLPFGPTSGAWMNTIGIMANTEGYCFKVISAGELPLTGTPVELPFEIPLNEGWNIISYPCNVSQNAFQVFGTLIENDPLLKVMDEQGRIVFHLPFPEPAGQWINTIGNLEPNKGYYLKVSEETALVFNEPASSVQTTKALLASKKTSHFAVVWENNPFMPMQIILEPNDELTTGDEIGIFDGSLCTGAAIYDGNMGNPLIMVCSLDDPYTEITDGFSSGNEITIQIWDYETQSLIDNPEIEFLEGQTTFTALEHFTGRIMSLTTSISDSGLDDFWLEVCPNAGCQTPVIKMFIPVSGRLLLTVYDITGKPITQTDVKAFSDGFFEISADKLFPVSGVYMLDYRYFYQDKIIYGSNKIVILK